MSHLLQRCSATFALCTICCATDAAWSPSFSVEPTNSVVQLGGTVQFYAEAVIGGGETISYQWLRNGVTIEHATNPQLQVPNVSIEMQRDGFAAVASSSGGQRTTSMVARVRVLNSPPIVDGTFALEQKRHAIAGANVPFGAGVIGAKPMFYQWYDGANVLHGERDAFLTVTNNYSSGPFYAVVSNAFGVGTGIVSQVQVSYSMDILRRWETNGFGVIDIARGFGGDFYSLRESLFSTPPGAQPTISRHGTNLEPKWSFQVLSGARLQSIGADADGNIYAWGHSAGTFSWGTNQIFPNTTSTQVFLGKIDRDGKALWAVPFREGSMSRPAGMIVESNAIWTAAAVLTTTTQGQMRRTVTVRRINFEGTVEETIALTNTPPFARYTNITVLGFDAKRFSRLPDGGIVIGGSSLYRTNLGGFFVEPFVGAVIAFERDGTIRWWKEFTSEDRWNDNAGLMGMTTDAVGNTYVSGRYGERSGAFLNKLGPDGTALWRAKAETDTWQTGSGVYPRNLEVAPNGNIRVIGMARFVGPLGYSWGGDYLPESPFVHDFSPAGELLNTTYFVLKRGEERGTDPLDLFSLGGEVFLGGTIRSSGDPNSPGRGFIANLGYIKEPVSTNAPSHVIFWSAVGGTIRPEFKATGPAAFEWHRDGQIMPNESFSYLGLSPAEVESPAHYTLIVRTLGGAITNSPISVGRLKMLRNPVGIEVHSPPGVSAEVSRRLDFNGGEGWLVVTNSSDGTPIRFPSGEPLSREFFRIDPRR